MSLIHANTYARPGILNHALCLAADRRAVFFYRSGRESDRRLGIPARVGLEVQGMWVPRLLS